MNRLVILGGGVGGTLTANLLARRLRHALVRGEASITVVDAFGAHVSQPGFMYPAMGHEREEQLQRPERGLLDDKVDLVVDEVTGVDATRREVRLGGGGTLPYDELVIATGARILPEAIPHFDEEAHHFYTA